MDHRAPPPRPARRLAPGGPHPSGDRRGGGGGGRPPSPRRSVCRRRAGGHDRTVRLPPVGVTAVRPPPVGVTAGRRNRWSTNHCSGAHSGTGQTSLKLCSEGPSGPTTTRHADATSRNIRHDTSSPTPSAHATAALIGETWLTTTTSVTLACVRHLLAGRSDAASHRSDGLATLRPPGGVRPPCRPHGRRHLGDRLAVVDAVIQLDPALVDDDRRPQQGGGLARPQQGTGHDAGRPGDVPPPGQGPGLAQTELGQRRVQAAEEQVGGVGRRLAVTQENQHPASTFGMSIRHPASGISIRYQVRTRIRPH